MPFNFLQYTYTEPDYADRVPAMRTKESILEGKVLGMDAVVYPAKFTLRYERGYVFLIVNKETGEVLYHSEAETPELAIQDAERAHTDQRKTIQKVREFGMKKFEKAVSGLSDLIFDGHDYIHRSGLCRVGFIAFCERFDFHPERILIEEMIPIISDRKERRAKYVLYWIIEKKRLAIDTGCVEKRGSHSGAPFSCGRDRIRGQVSKFISLLRSSFVKSFLPGLVCLTA